MSSSQGWLAGPPAIHIVNSSSDAKSNGRGLNKLETLVIKLSPSGLTSSFLNCCQLQALMQSTLGSDQGWLLVMVELTNICLTNPTNTVYNEVSWEARSSKRDLFRPVLWVQVLVTIAVLPFTAA
jgi:hypothetical protein